MSLRVHASWIDPLDDEASLGLTNLDIVVEKEAHPEQPVDTEMPVSELNEFERAVLRMLLAGDDPRLSVLRDQLLVAHVRRREYTGVGFHTDLYVPDKCPAAPVRDFHVGDVNVALDCLRHGAGVVAFVRAGRLDSLEGYSYDEPWPLEIGAFTLAYHSEPRRLNIPSD